MPTSSKPVTKFDAAMAKQLNKLYSSQQVVAQRAKFRTLVAAQRGEIGLDIGCGVGHLACELGREVSPGGRIVAVDSSVDMIKSAAARLAREKLDHCVEVRLGDAIALDFAPQSVDFVVAVQVLCYIPDVGRAMAEIARVLRKGGRLAILETDWDLCLYESMDEALTRRILDGRWRFAHPHLPRQLHRLIREAGLMLTRSDAFPIIETRYDPDSFGAGLVAIARDAAVRNGIAAEEADAWALDIRSRANDGEYFFCTNRFMFVATK